MKVKWTVSEAARVAGCSDNTLRTMAAAGQVKTEKAERTGIMMLLGTREQLRAAVQQAHPQAGWKRHSNRRGKNGSQEKHPKTSAALAPVLSWLALDAAKRKLALELAGKYSAEDLRLLLTL